MIFLNDSNLVCVLAFYSSFFTRLKKLLKALIKTFDEKMIFFGLRSFEGN